MKNLPTKDQYIIYSRKSSESEDRQMASIPAQIKAFKPIIRERKLKILKTFKESMSAKVPGRPLFNEMVNLIDSRSDIKGIICWKPNRLFRNPEDEGRIRQRLSDGRIKEIVTPNKTYYEPDSDFIMAVEGAQAQRFIRDLREDTQRGIDRKLDKGFAPILAPVGYKNNIRRRKGDKNIIPHPIYFPLVRKLFEIAMTGNFSLESLAIKSKGLGIKNNRGGKFVSKSQMADILRNKFYVGKFTYAGKEYNGRHKPMLTPDEYQLIQDVMSGKSKPRKEIHDFPLTGLIRCGECGSMITAEEHIKHYKNGKSQTFTYYRCTKKCKKDCHQRYVPAKDLEMQVISYLHSITISDKFIDWAIKQINDANATRKEFESGRLKVLQNEYNGIRRKLGNLLDMKIDPSNKNGCMLSDEEFQLKKASLLADKEAISRQLNNHDKEADEWIELTSKTFDFAATAQKRFETGTPETKKLILKVIGSNLLIKDRILKIEPRKPFLLIEGVVKSEITNTYSLEPVINDVNTAINGDLPSQKSYWGE